MSYEYRVAIIPLGIRQYEIAEHLGVSESRLSKFLRGRGTLSADEELRLRELLGLQVESQAETPTMIPLTASEANSASVAAPTVGIGQLCKR